MKEVERHWDPTGNSFQQSDPQMIDDVAPDQWEIQMLAEIKEGIQGKLKPRVSRSCKSTKVDTKSSLVSEDEHRGSLLGADDVTSTAVGKKAELLSSDFVPESHREWRPRQRMVRKLTAGLKKLQSSNPDSLNPRSRKILFAWSLKPCQLKYHEDWGQC